MKKGAKITESRTSEAAPSAAELDARRQRTLFSEAMKKFAAGDFRSALQGFEQAASGTDLSVGETARMYCRMCQQRLGQAKVELRTPEEQYDYAVSLMNLGDYAAARRHLEGALNGNEGAHVRYALGITLGMLGDERGAVEHLRQAFRLDARLRSMARSDADFQQLLERHPIRELLAGDPAPAH
jgi:tetratricopeptide (TPR) repeat protein